MSVDFLEAHESQVRTYCREFPRLFDYAEDCFIDDTAGVRYLDFLAGAGSLNYGHNNPLLLEALIAHLRSGRVCQSLDLFTVAKSEFVQAMVEHVLAPRGLGEYKLQFTGPTGTNAVEAALKLARKVTGRMDVVAFTDGFHGVSLGALAASGESGKRRAAGQPLPNVLRAAYDGYHGPQIDTIALMERLFDDPNSGWAAPAAFIVEAVQGEGGLNAASPAWLQRLAALAKRLGALLILDEIQSGCGRTGHFFAFEAAGIMPDIVCVSKSISGFGLPMALILIRPEHDCWAPGEHNGTFRGSNLSFATATAAIDAYWRDDAFIEDVRSKAVMVRARLSEIADRTRECQVVGRGLMMGLRFTQAENARKVARRCFDRQLIIETCGPRSNTLKLLPPLTTPLSVLLDGLEIVANAVASVQQSHTLARDAA